MQFHRFFIVVLVVSDSFVTPWTVARQALLSMKFPRQGYWSGLPFPSPGDLPNPGMEPRSPMSPALQVNSLLLGPRLRYTNSNPKNSGINIVVKGENKILYRMSASC